MNTKFPENKTADYIPHAFSFCLVPAGELIMEDGEHKIQIPEFRIGKFPVTQREFQSVMGHNPSQYRTGEDHWDRPVENVSWHQAVEFCQKATKALGYKVQLPSEAMWEWAAQGATKTMGYVYAGSNDFDAVGWGIHNSGSETHPVGQLKPNELGIYDMSGNVWEWCQDRWSDPTELPKDGTPLLTSGDPSCRSVRGGSWCNRDIHCESGYRNRSYPNATNSHRGFRIVLIPV